MLVGVVINFPAS